MRQPLLHSRTALHRNNWGRPVTVNYLSKSTNEYHIKPDKPGRNQKISFYISIIFTMRRIDHKTGSCE